MFGNSYVDGGSSRAQSMKACNDHFTRRQALCDEPTHKELEAEHGGGGAARGERDWTCYAVQDCAHNEEELNSVGKYPDPSYDELVDAPRSARSTVTRYTLHDEADPFNNCSTVHDPRTPQQEWMQTNQYSPKREALMQRKKSGLMSNFDYDDGQDEFATYAQADEFGLSGRVQLGALDPVELDDTRLQARSCREERQAEGVSQLKACAHSARMRGSYGNYGMH